MKAGDTVIPTTEGQRIFPSLVGRKLVIKSISQNAIIFEKYPNASWAREYFKKFDGFTLDAEDE